jgi:gluconate 5-dehydrogenase
MRDDPRVSRHLFDLSARTALVTGSSRGIGLTLARGLGQAGARVVLNGRDTDRLAAVAGELRDEGLGVEVAPFDVTDKAAPASDFVHGQIIYVDGGLTAVI